jgi:hypothetical protein
MANHSRHEDKSTQSSDDAARRASEKNAEQMSRIGQAAADQTARVGQAAAEAGDDVARAGANLLKQNVETLQDVWRVGLDTATSVMGRSTEHVGRTLGLSGDGVQQATEQSARNAQAILQTGTTAARMMGGMNRECLQMVQRQVEKNIEHMKELWACRTPRDLAAVQTDMIRETVEIVLQSSHRIADMSLKMADDAGKRIKQNLEEIQRAA